MANLTEPRVSVIIPMFNAEQYLERCLTSVVSQTLREIEVVCVDDRSTDSTPQIAESMSRRDDRIKLVRTKANSGPGGARNLGIASSSGEFIAFVDSDDTIETNALEKAWSLAQGADADIVAFGYNEVQERGGTVSRFLPKHQGIMESPGSSRNLFAITNPACWNKLWRSSAISKNDIIFPENIYFEDLATTPIACYHARRIAFIDEPLYNYYIRDGSITNSATSKHISDILYVFFYLSEKFKELGVWEDQKYNCVRHVERAIKRHYKHAKTMHFIGIDESVYYRCLSVVKKAVQDIAVDTAIEDMSTVDRVLLRSGKDRIQSVLAKIQFYKMLY